MPPQVQNFGATSGGASSSSGSATTGTARGGGFGFSGGLFGARGGRRSGITGEEARDDIFEREQGLIDEQQQRDQAFEQAQAELQGQIDASEASKDRLADPETFIAPAREIFEQTQANLQQANNLEIERAQQELRAFEQEGTDARGAARFLVRQQVTRAINNQANILGSQLLKSFGDTVFQATVLAAENEKAIDADILDASTQLAGLVASHLASQNQFSASRFGTTTNALTNLVGFDTDILKARISARSNERTAKIQARAQAASDAVKREIAEINSRADNPFQVGVNTITAPGSGAFDRGSTTIQTTFDPLDGDTSERVLRQT